MNSSQLAALPEGILIPNIIPFPTSHQREPEVALTLYKEAKDS